MPLVLALLAVSVALPTLAERVVGTWTLVSYEARYADGRVAPVYGPSPVGRLIYDARGRMSVHIADPRRAPFASTDRLLATDAEVRAAFDGYFGYFGTYSVDEQAGTMTHHVQGAAFPNYTGSDQTRKLAVEGDRLELATPPIARAGERATFHVVWRRERD
ncbi:MAG: lipocalin-like domain-containing protein [Vicinamibacteria bacterium]